MMSIIEFWCGYLAAGVFAVGFFIGADWALKVKRTYIEYLTVLAFLFFWPIAAVIVYRFSSSEAKDE